MPCLDRERGGRGGPPVVRFGLPGRPAPSEVHFQLKQDLWDKKSLSSAKDANRFGEMLCDAAQEATRTSERAAMALYVLAEQVYAEAFKNAGADLQAKMVANKGQRDAKEAQQKLERGNAAGGPCWKIVSFEQNLEGWNLHNGQMNPWGWAAQFVKSKDPLQPWHSLASTKDCGDFELDFGIRVAGAKSRVSMYWCSVGGKSGYWLQLPHGAVMQRSLNPRRAPRGEGVFYPWEPLGNFKLTAGFDLTQWQHIRLVMKTEYFKIWLNGQLAFETKEPRFKTGRVSLSVLQEPYWLRTVRFRESSP